MPDDNAISVAFKSEKLTTPTAGAENMAWKPVGKYPKSCSYQVNCELAAL